MAAAATPAPRRLLPLHRRRLVCVDSDGPFNEPSGCYYMQPRQWPVIARFAPGPTVFQLRSHHDLRLETQETRPRACSGHMTTRSMFPQHLRSPMLTFATKKLSTSAQGQKEDAAPPFVSAVLIELS